MAEPVAPGAQNAGESQTGGQVLMDDPLFKHDNNELHYLVHRKFILGDEFKTLDEKTRTVAIVHTENHETVMKQEQQAQQQAQIAAEQAKRTPPQTPTT